MTESVVAIKRTSTGHVQRTISRVARDSGATDTGDRYQTGK